MSKNTFVIFDLDNCISDDEWRIPKINWSIQQPDRRYEMYHSLSAFDEFKNGAMVDEALENNHGIIVFTARPVQFAAMTREWLVRVAGVKPFAILMRNNNDHRNSVDLKRDQLNQLEAFWGIERGQIVRAYDDRRDIVEMYRQEGLAAQQLAIHNSCAMINPTKEK